MVFYNEAQKFSKAKNHALAIGKYKDAFKVLIPSHDEYEPPLLLPPSSRERVEKTRYIDFNHHERMFFMQCCNAIANCYQKLGNDVAVSMPTFCSFPAGH